MVGVILESLGMVAFLAWVESSIINGPCLGKQDCLLSFSTRRVLLKKEVKHLIKKEKHVSR